MARTTLLAPLLAAASRLRFPTLLGLTALLFVVDLIVPDAIPLVDEILLGLATAVLASLRKRKDEEPETIDVTPPSGP